MGLNWTLACPPCSGRGSSTAWGSRSSAAPRRCERASRRSGRPRAGLENLARTLSIEWARHRIRPVAILPGSAGDVAELVAFLASPAGAYYSGCAFTLR